MIARARLDARTAPLHQLIGDTAVQQAVGSRQSELRRAAAAHASGLFSKRLTVDRALQALMPLLLPPQRLPQPSEIKDDPASSETFTLCLSEVDARGACAAVLSAHSADGASDGPPDVNRPLR